MDKNFWVRWVCGWAMFIAAIIAVYAFDGIPFKVLFGVFAVLAGIELLSFFHKKFSISNAILALIEIAFLVFSAISMARINVNQFWFIIFGVCGYDVWAYLCGRMVGGKIFKRSRPFPHISKNKTWEGTVLGLLLSAAQVAICIAIFGNWGTDWYFMLGGGLALVGDLYESFLKRRFDVKDSNEIVIKNPVFEKLELVVGGAKGHGGFLDRLDSLAFATTVFLVISVVL